MVVRRSLMSCLVWYYISPKYEYISRVIGTEVRKKTINKRGKITTNNFYGSPHLRAFLSATPTSTAIHRDVRFPFEHRTDRLSKPKLKVDLRAPNLSL